MVFPNGATVLPGSSYVLIADFSAGRVFSVNVDTGDVQVAVDGPAVNVPSGAAGGVYGVHSPGDGFLYFTNTGTQSYGRIPVDISTASSTGDAQILFQNGSVTPDDFALDPLNGSTAAYIADSSGNRIVHVSGMSDNYQDVTNVAGPTSVVVSGGLVYISSTGGDDDYAQDPIIVGGALSQV